MKNTFKKIVSVMLSLAFAVSAMFALASCGDTKDDVYFLGATGPLTGDAAQYGISVNNGALLAVKEINAQGGLNGVNFFFEMKDDEAGATGAQNGYNALYEAGMQASLGSVTSGSCEAFATLANEDGVFAMSPSASEAGVIKNRPTVFRSCFGDPDQAEIAAQTIAEQYNNVGVIYDTSDPYSKGLYDAFAAKMTELGKTFTTQSFNKENNKSFDTQVDALKACDVIFLPIYYTEAGLIAVACEAKGCEAALFGCDGLDGIDTQIAGKNVSNKITYITPFDVNSTDEKVSSFVSAYQAEYGAKPDQFAAGAYDTVWAIYKAMVKAGVDDVNISAQDLAQALVAAFTSDDFSYSGVTGNITWNESGAPTKEPKIVEVN